MSIKTKLNAPFPFVSNTTDKVLLSLFLGSFIYIFLMLFQPFGIMKIESYKPIFVLGYGVITSITVLLNFFLHPLFYPNFNKVKWNVGKTFTYSLINILSISIFNWVYTATIGKEIMEQHSLLMFIFITLSVGSIPSLFLILLLERFLDIRNKREANELTSHLSEDPKVAPIEIVIQKNKLSIYLANLLCIKAEGNYVEIHYLKDDIVKKELIRSSLSKMKIQLKDYHQIKHCHRSFIVNTQHLIKVTGNARNFNLHLKHLGFSIPVSRSFPIHTIKK